ncbi:MAG: hypothetical protein HY716_16595 [Planctomycetes bacterium]|nr:hypothetical protein [Planctomycetota bacterium]
MKRDILPDLDVAKRLILELGHAGVRLGTRGRHITYDAPRGVLTAEIRERLRANRSLICNLLAQSSREGGRELDALRGPQVNAAPSRRIPCWYPSHPRWISIYGAMVCGVCHPPADPSLVASWEGAE